MISMIFRLWHSFKRPLATAWLHRTSLPFLMDEDFPDDLGYSPACIFCSRWKELTVDDSSGVERVIMVQNEGSCMHGVRDEGPSFTELCAG